MKKQESGRIVFPIYLVFLVLMVWLGWNTDRRIIPIVSGVAAVFILYGAVMQFLPREHFVLSGYGVVGTTALFVAVIFFFRLLFPANRLFSFAIFALSVAVGYHCIYALMQKKA